MPQFQLRGLLLDAIRFDKADVPVASESGNVYF
jgi:hypothetical protein